MLNLLVMALYLGAMLYILIAAPDRPREPWAGYPREPEERWDFWGEERK